MNETSRLVDRQTGWLAGWQVGTNHDGFVQIDNNVVIQYCEQIVRYSNDSSIDLKNQVHYDNDQKIDAHTNTKHIFADITSLSRHPSFFLYRFKLQIYVARIRWQTWNWKWNVSRNVEYMYVHLYMLTVSINIVKFVYIDFGIELCVFIKQTHILYNTNFSLRRQFHYTACLLCCWQAAATSVVIIHSFIHLLARSFAQSVWHVHSSNWLSDWKSHWIENRTSANVWAKSSEEKSHFYNNTMSSRAYFMTGKPGKQAGMQTAENIYIYK